MESSLAVNDRVELRLGDEGRRHQSRVEGIQRGVLTVARPLDAGVTADEIGGEVLVAWGGARGVSVLPAVLAAEREEAGLRLWTLAVTGPSWMEQRRAFVRVPAHGQLILQSAEGEEAVAELVDVSEAALRCRLVPCWATAPDADQLEVMARFRLGGGAFTLPARLELCRTPLRDHGHVDVLVMFDSPVNDATALRREIYAQQLRAVRPR